MSYAIDPNCRLILVESLKKRNIKENEQFLRLIKSRKKQYLNIHKLNQNKSHFNN